MRNKVDKCTPATSEVWQNKLLGFTYEKAVIGKRNNRKRKLFKQVRGSYYRHQSKLQLNVRVFCSRVPYGPDLKSNKEKPMLK